MPRLPLLRLLLPALLLACSRTAAAAEPAPTFADKPLSFWLERLRDADPLTREEAATVLGDLGPSAKEALPALHDLLKSDAGPLRLRAAMAVWKVGHEARETAPVLIAALRDGGRGQRLVILQTLGEMGPAAEAAAPLLTGFLSDANASVRNQASLTLLQLGPAAVPALVKGLEHDDAEVRRQCVGL